MPNKHRKPFDQCFTMVGQCMVWSETCDGYGHPIRSLNGRVHRVAHLIFEAYHGYKPTQIKHTCGNQKCINIAHLADAKLAKEEIMRQQKLGQLRERAQYLELAIANLLEADKGDKVAAEAREIYKKELEQNKKEQTEITNAPQVSCPSPVP